MKRGISPAAWFPDKPTPWITGHGQPRSRPYDDRVTARRTLGTGPQDPYNIRATQADLLDTLPGVRLPDIGELRARGVLGAQPATPPAPRRILGAGGADEEPPHLCA